MNSNITRLIEIAKILGEINHEVVFVGGATVGLYIDDKAAPTPQPSEDIDCVVEIATYGEWCKFEDKLRVKGFKDFDSSSKEKGSPTCRKFILGIKVDFMPIDESVLGYGNPWFKKGLENSIQLSIENIEISIFKLEYFVATKLKAFNDRGLIGDIRFSQDLEDITELVDGAINFEKKISDADIEIKKYIIMEFKKMLTRKDDYQEAMYGFLGYDDNETREFRLKRIFEILNRLCR
jgi:hypothetical protein